MDLRIYLIGLLFVILSCQDSRKIIIYIGTIEQALADAAKEDKKLMLIITYPDCPPCEMLFTEMVEDVDYSKILSQYIIYKFDSNNPLN